VPAGKSQRPTAGRAGETHTTRRETCAST